MSLFSSAIFQEDKEPSNKFDFFDEESNNFNPLDNSFSLMSEENKLKNPIDLFESQSQLVNSKNNSDIDKVSSTVMNTESGMEYAVSIQTNMAGQDKLAAATKELAGTSTPLSIWFDNDLISAPTVATQIVDGNAIISGNLTAEKSMEIAAAIDSGALPCGLEITEHKIGDDKK